MRDEVQRESDRALVRRAIEARRFAWAPYSGFAVGAALLCADGTIFSGCNIENAAFSPSNCAERTAFFKAVSEGHRDFSAIAIVGGKVSTPESDLMPCPPCGVCRQVMSEFCRSGDFRILVASGEENYQVYLLEELLPQSFGADLV